MLGFKLDGVAWHDPDTHQPCLLRIKFHELVRFLGRFRLDCDWFVLRQVLAIRL